MKVFLKNAFDWLFPDDLAKTTSGLKKPVLNTPRGGVASICTVLTGLTPGERVAIATDLPGCRFYRLVDICVNRNTSENGFSADPKVDWRPLSKSIVRTAPYRVFDALEPLEGDFVPAGSECALYVQFPVRKSAKPGELPVTLSFSQGKERKSADLTVKVSSVAIPSVGKDSIPLTNWFSTTAMLHYGKKADTWRNEIGVLKEHAAMMAAARQNMFIVPLPHFFTYADGVFTLNEAKLKAFIKFFTDAGLYWIEGGHPGSRGEGGWTAPDFNVMLSGHSVKSIEGLKDLAQILTQLRKFIEKNHLQERWIQHVTDEPIEQNKDAYRIFNGIVRKFMPGYPILEALSDPALLGSVDYVCTQVQQYQMHQADFDSFRKFGDQIWTYTCCCPGGPFLNRLCDNELTRPLLLGWGNGYHNISGFLHWGWNQLCKYKRHPGWQNPLEETSPHEFGDSTNTLPPGDSHIVYHNPETGELWGSMRLEASRQGMEDWELIRLLMRKDPEKCRKIVRKVFRAYDDFTPSDTAIKAARKELLAALEK